METPEHLKKSREIVARIVVTGNLEAKTPLHLGNGDTPELPIDLPLLTDSVTGRPLLTGTTLAGSLRNYLRERAPEAATALFGGEKDKMSETEGDQSPLIIEDSVGEKTADREIRAGVKLNDQTRTADDEALYSYELWPVGTTFPIRLELLLSNHARSHDELKKALRTALQGLEDGAIAFGLKKNRGFGKMVLRDATVTKYNLRTEAGLLHWLISEPTVPSRRGWLNDFPLLSKPPEESLKDWKPGSVASVARLLTVEGVFRLDGSLLIRGLGDQLDAPDSVFLHRKPGNGKLEPILSGTSLAGALRARAERIVNTLVNSCGGKKDCGESFIKSLFGIHEEKKSDDEEPKESSASRFRTEETFIEGGETGLVQHRIKIDRFTGGAYETALFNEQPVFGDLKNSVAVVKVKFSIRKPEPADIGLALLLIKDLWTGDLPLGGGANVGRGRLMGDSLTFDFSLPDCGGVDRGFTLSLKQNDKQMEHTIERHTKDESKPIVNNLADLNEYARHLREALGIADE